MDMMRVTISRLLSVNNFVEKKRTKDIKIKAWEALDFAAVIDCMSPIITITIKTWFTEGLGVQASTEACVF